MLKLDLAKTEEGKEYFKQDIIWDIETYPNVFTLAACFANGKGMRVYEISHRRNDLEEMLEFLRKAKVGGFRMVGFNNIGFDYPVLHYILGKSKSARERGMRCEITCEELYRVVQNMFDEQADSRFGAAVKSSEVIMPQVDLFKINHFDNKARMTSLKMLENNMRSQNIEDLPFPVGTVLKDEEIDELIRYNKHDVSETLKFYYYCMEGIKMRAELSSQFGFDCTNLNDTAIGKSLFVNRLETNNPGCCYKMVKQGAFMKRQMRQTKRKSINLGECVLPKVRFDRPEFQAIHKWFMNKTIVETKGALSDIEEHDLGDVAKYATMKVKSIKMNCPEQGSKNKRYVPTREHVDELMKLHPMGWIETKELKSPKGAASYNFCWRIAEGLNVVIDGFQYDFGTGGIHGSTRGIHQSCDEYDLHTSDIKSMYPNCSIRNRLYPEHLGEGFCDVYEDLYNERIGYDKKDPRNAALKLALNGTYGASNDKFSPMYDPKFTMSITVNGQLMLCMIMERIINEVDGKIVMCNTDGFEYLVPKKHRARVAEIMMEWEKVTGFEMESDRYSKMLVRDVNNYVAIKEKKDD